MNNDWKVSIFNNLKEEMGKTLSLLEVENIKEIEGTMNQQWSVIHSMTESLFSEEKAEVVAEEKVEVKPEAKKLEQEPSEQPVILEEIAEEKPQVVHQKQEEPAVKNNAKLEQTIEEFADVFDEEEEKVSYRMKKTLVGGSLQGASDSYVPEKIIRELGLEDGDFISTEILSYENNKPMYRFELVKKGIPHSSITQFSYAIVDYDTLVEKFYIEKNAFGELIRIEDVPQKLYLPDYAISKFSIRVGDIIDIAWYGNNVSKFSVAWKHSTSDIPETKLTEERKVLEHRKAKKNSENNDEPTEEQLAQLKNAFGNSKKEKPDLSGLTVTIVGGYDFYDNYKEVLNKNNVKYFMIPDDAHLMKMTAAIRRSNLVLINVDYVSHGDMKAAKERAKKYNIPFKTFKGLGRTVLYNTIVEQKQAMETITAN